MNKIRGEISSPEPMDISQASGLAGAAPGNQEDNWQREADAVDVKEEDLREFYQAALEGSKYDSADLQAVHLFASKAQASLDPRSVRLLTRPVHSLTHDA